MPFWGWQFCIFASLLNPSEKGSAFKGNVLFPLRAFFKVDPFQKVLLAQESKQEVTKVVSLVKKKSKTLPNVSIPLQTKLDCTDKKILWH